MATDINEVVDKLTSLVNNGTEKAKVILDRETSKAKIRSEIGRNKKELVEAYERLGRNYYASKVTDIELEGEDELMSVIRSKEKLIELLNEKLADLDK